jgi:uncharacterized protein (TIGR02145 family)
MKRTTIIIAVLLGMVLNLQGQVPQKFSYQAVLRNADGTVISNQTVAVKVSLRKESSNGAIVYVETQDVPSNLGIINLTIGSGTILTGVFDTIPWGSNIFLQIEVKKSGDANYLSYGTTQIFSVPYAIRAGNVKEVTSQANAAIDEPIFVVKNKDGKIVFGVYQGGVRIYVEDKLVKGSKGGFAVGGLSNQGKVSVIPDILYVDPDSTRLYFKEATSKGAKGGFAVGGLTNQSKVGEVYRDRLLINTDSTRLYVNGDLIGQANGGFAITGLSGTPTANINFFKVTKDSTLFSNNIYTQGNIVSTGSISTGGGVASTPVSDIEGNTYQTIKIGSQTWMKENLRTRTFSDGSGINPFYVKAYDTTSNLVAIKNYGLLYMGMALSNQTMNVCPDGWRVPTPMDWDSLMFYVGGPYWQTSSIITGLKLMEPGIKANGTGLWDFDLKANNASGFSARPGGEATMSTQWIFFGIGTEATWWMGQGSSQYVKIDGNTGNVTYATGSPSNAYSIRCIKGFPVAIKK